MEKKRIIENNNKKVKGRKVKEKREKGALRPINANRLYTDE